MNNNHSTVRGIGFSGLLCIVFITLKLTKTIDWSWVWVVSPLWIPLALWLIGLIIFVACRFVKKLWKERHCLLKGHNFVKETEHHKGPYGESWYPVTRCTKCGKIKTKDDR